MFLTYPHQMKRAFFHAAITKNLFMRKLAFDFVRQSKGQKLQLFSLLNKRDVNHHQVTFQLHFQSSLSLYALMVP